MGQAIAERILRHRSQKQKDRLQEDRRDSRSRTIRGLRFDSAVTCSPGNVKCGGRCFPAGHQCGGESKQATKKAIRDVKIKALKRELTKNEQAKTKTLAITQSTHRTMKLSPVGSERYKRAAKAQAEGVAKLEQIAANGKNIILEIDRAKGE